MIFIPGNVPSSKNSKVSTSKGIFHSKTVRKYLQYIGVKGYSVTKKTVDEYKTRQNVFKNSVSDYFDGVDVFPVMICFHFVRDSKRKADFHNLVQIVSDLLVAHDFIPDDNMDYFLPFPMMVNGNWWSVNKENPGVFISIEK